MLIFIALLLCNDWPYHSFPLSWNFITLLDVPPQGYCYKKLTNSAYFSFRSLSSDLSLFCPKLLSLISMALIWKPIVLFSSTVLIDLVDQSFVSYLSEAFTNPEKSYPFFPSALSSTSLKTFTCQAWSLIYQSIFLPPLKLLNSADALFLCLIPVLQQQSVLKSPRVLNCR